MRSTYTLTSLQTELQRYLSAALERPIEFFRMPDSDGIYFFLDLKEARTPAEVAIDHVWERSK